MKPHVAIVGAGLAGSVLTQRLLRAGFAVTVFEKSRGTGGRLSTCRLGDYTADLGAPFFQETSGAFGAWLQQQQQVTQWHPVACDFQGNQITSADVSIASPRQSALTRSLIAGAEFCPSTRVGYVWPELIEGKAGLIVRDDKGKGLGQYDAVVVATPALQAAPLLEAIPRFMKRAEAVKPEMAWVHVMVTYSENCNTPDLFTGAHEVFARIIKDNSKPGRICPDNSDVWTVEANPEWSREHENSCPEDVARYLREAFLQLLPVHNHVIAERTHRWLYARHSKIAADFLWDTDSRIGVCGDWFGHSQAEGAWQSAELLAQALIDYFIQTQSPQTGEVLAI